MALTQMPWQPKARVSGVQLLLMIQGPSSANLTFPSCTVKKTNRFERKAQKIEASGPVQFGHFDVAVFELSEYDSADETSVVSDCLFPFFLEIAGSSCPSNFKVSTFFNSKQV